MNFQWECQNWCYSINMWYNICFNRNWKK